MTETESTDPTADDASMGAVEAPDGTDVTSYLYRGALVLLVLLAVVAALQLYFAVGRAISIWISRDFAPVFQAGFNLVVLLAAAIGISVVLRRMGE